MSRIDVSRSIKESRKVKMSMSQNPLYLER
jgi:hypothetical protein